MPFFKIHFYKKVLSETQSESQTVWTQTRTDVLSVLIWVQIVCKCYQQTTRVNGIAKLVPIISGLFSLQEIIRLCNSEKYYVTVRMRRIQDVSDAHEDLRALDKLDEPYNSTEKFILLDLSTEPAYHKIMKQVHEWLNPFKTNGIFHKV